MAGFPVDTLSAGVWTSNSPRVVKRVVLQQGRLVLPRRVVTGDLAIEDGVIATIAPHITPASGDEVVDARGLLVLPGLIDSQVRFRAYTRHGNEDLHTGTMAAVRGGVTSILEVPDKHPLDVHDPRSLADKLALARETCVIDHGFWIRARADNFEEAAKTDGVIGARLVLDASDVGGAERWFADYPGILAVHAEDRGRLRARYAIYETAPDVTMHHRIRDVETVVSGTRLALKLAARHGTRLHLLHVSSAEEVKLLAERDRDRVTCAAALPHLVLDAEATKTLGTRAQCNPPLRSSHHREALWQGLREGVLDLVCSDHCPHGLITKRVPYPESASGMPGVEWLLPQLLTAAAAREVKLTEVVRWASEAPARAFGLARKGRLEVGYDADVVLVDPTLERTVTDANTRSATGWSPYAGQVLTGWPVSVWSGGRPVLQNGELDPRTRGRPLSSRSPA